MRAGETLYYLEMRSLTELRHQQTTPEQLRLVEERDPATVRNLTLAIGRPYDWPSQHWDHDAWTEYLRRPDIRHWRAELDENTLGLASLRFDNDEVELDSFGLVPEHVGRGRGGACLALVAELVWGLRPTTERFWLHTSSADHPNALTNYQRRGFRLYRTDPPGEQ